LQVNTENFSKIEHQYDLEERYSDHSKSGTVRINFLHDGLIEDLLDVEFTDTQLNGKINGNEKQRQMKSSQLQQPSKITVASTSLADKNQRKLSVEPIIL